MKIRTSSGQILHVEKSPLTQILIDAGLASIVKDTPTSAPIQSLTTWEVGFPDESVDTKHVEVRLLAKCSNPKCVARFQIFYGPTAGKTARFVHCSRVDSCPENIAVRYGNVRQQMQKG